MNSTFAPIFRAAKQTYYGVFNSIATAALRQPGTNLTRTKRDTPSVKIVSYYGRQNGISEGALLQHAALKALGYDAEIVDVTGAMRNPFARIDCEEADVFIVHCGGDHFLPAAWPLRRILPRRRVVAYFAWELPDPPRDWPSSRSLWHEIWTPSRYSARSLSKWSDCPIKVVPHVLLRDDTEPKRWRKGEEPLVFLTIADARSSLSRKNPRGAVKAFQMAFPQESNVELIVKLQKTEIQGSPELDELLVAIKSDPRIRLINGTLTRNEMNGLFLSAHTFLSLHRAEGFGIPLLEAQSLGLATIATAWSGNMDFMTEQTSLLIPYTIATMHDVGGVYGRVNWADPDVHSAATAMRRLYDDPNELARFAKAGWEANRPKKQLDMFATALQHTLVCS
jgi:glycosyltransferase involved in cell wall biosynthesis